MYVIVGHLHCVYCIQITVLLLRCHTSYMYPQGSTQSLGVILAKLYPLSQALEESVLAGHSQRAFNL